MDCNILDDDDLEAARGIEGLRPYLETNSVLLDGIPSHRTTAAGAAQESK